MLLKKLHVFDHVTINLIYELLHFVCSSWY